MNSMSSKSSFDKLLAWIVGVTPCKLLSFHHWFIRQLEFNCGLLIVYGRSRLVYTAKC